MGGLKARPYKDFALAEPGPKTEPAEDGAWVEGQGRRILF